MHITRDGRFERTDIWREGKWLDLWSVVHFLSGMTTGFILYFIHLGPVVASVGAFFAFTAYELWEARVGIEEAPTNRVMDVVVGMASFLPVFFLLAPRLSGSLDIFVFGFTLTANVVMSIFGWVASKKAAALEERARTRYARGRERLRERTARVREKLHRSRELEG